MFSVGAVACCWVFTTYYRFHQYVSYVSCGVSVGGFFFFFFFFFLSPKLRVLQLVFWVGMCIWSRFKDKPCLPCDVDNNNEEYVVDLITPISGGSAV